MWLLFLLATATAVGLSSARLETKGLVIMVGIILITLAFYTLKYGAL